MICRKDRFGKSDGFGGVFFRARDPESLSRWYVEHLGVTETPAEYFRRSDKAWMINFRVRDLDAMLVKLRASGTAVEVDPEDYPMGRFARLSDPEDNQIELWEPRGPHAASSASG